MTGDQAGGRDIPRRLRESLERLREDIDRVEVWAGALEGFAQPIPDYGPPGDHKLPTRDDDETLIT